MTSDARKIYDALLAEFPHAMQEISLLSRNTAEAKAFILSEVNAFNFDVVKNFGAISHGEKEQTPDALFLCDDGKLYFVEFKEGGADKTDVRQKIHEGIISLYQFALTRKILNREQFLALSINYAVVRRYPPRGQPTPSTLGVIESTRDFFSLKNMEGLFVESTTTLFQPESIFQLLGKLSNGAVTQIAIVTPDQQFCELIPPPQSLPDEGKMKQGP